MNRYAIRNSYTAGPMDKQILAAKLLITGSGVAIFKDFDGDNFLVLKEYNTIELVEKDVEEEDEDEETAGGFTPLQKD